MLQNDQIKIVKTRYPETVLPLRAGHPELEQVIRPVEYLFDRLGLGETLPDQPEYSIAVVDVEQQCVKEPVLRLGDDRPPADEFRYPLLAGENVRQHLAPFSAVPLDRRLQKALKPLPRLLEPEHF